MQGFPRALSDTVPRGFAQAYSRLARKEEQRMVEQFGEEFRAYQRRVPMFLPRRGQWRQLVERSHDPADKVDRPR